MQWTVIVAVKALPGAKSRLAGASRDDATHRALVEAIRADTVDAALATRSVARVLLVADDVTVLGGFAGATGIVQHSSGLNGALRDGARHAAGQWPDDGAAALVGDLPALQPDELEDALREAVRHPHAFVPDAGATGTTLLTARAPGSLRPEFGAGSATRHAAFAATLAAHPGLRRDVDTADDLASAATLGVGPATALVLAAASSSGRSPGAGIVERMTDDSEARA